VSANLIGQGLHSIDALCNVQGFIRMFVRVEAVVLEEFDLV
jgi:hypothetical protein